MLVNNFNAFSYYFYKVMPKGCAEGSVLGISVLGEGVFEYFDHLALTAFVREIGERYPWIGTGVIGTSILGRSIPLLSLGSGERSVLYIGAHHGMEWITSALLVLLVREIAEAYERDLVLFGVSVRTMLRLRRIHIVPMLNPDGVDYAIHGIESAGILRERVIAMCDGTDISRWQANARGVDLNHNYNSGFEDYKVIERSLGIYRGAPTRYSGEYPESEPEVHAICNFVRYAPPSLALTLHTQGEEIYYTSGGRCTSECERIARRVADMTAYALAVPKGAAAYGGFTDWLVGELGLPSLTLECGRGENPLPPSLLCRIYSRLRRALICAPTLI